MAEGDSEGGIVFPSSLSISSFPESGVTTAPADMIYDIASRLYTNTNFEILEEPLDSFVKKCIYRGMIFTQIYDSLKPDEIDSSNNEVSKSCSGSSSDSSSGSNSDESSSDNSSSDSNSCSGGGGNCEGSSDNSSSDSDSRSGGGGNCEGSSDSSDEDENINLTFSVEKLETVAGPENGQYQPIRITINLKNNIDIVGLHLNIKSYLTELIGTEVEIKKTNRVLCPYENNIWVPITDSKKDIYLGDDTNSTIIRTGQGAILYIDFKGPIVFIHGEKANWFDFNYHIDYMNNNSKKSSEGTITLVEEDMLKNDEYINTSEFFNKFTLEWNPNYQIYFNTQTLHYCNENNEDVNDIEPEVIYTDHVNKQHRIGTYSMLGKIIGRKELFVEYEELGYPGAFDNFEWPGDDEYNEDGFINPVTTFPDNLWYVNLNAPDRINSNNFFTNIYVEFFCSGERPEGNYKSIVTNFKTLPTS